MKNDAPFLMRILANGENDTNLSFAEAIIRNYNIFIYLSATTLSKKRIYIATELAKFGG